ERVDHAVAEVPDEQLAGERAERCRRDRESPGRVEHSARGDAPDQRPLGVERIYDAVARTGDVVARGPDDGIAHVERTAEVLDVEWRIARGQVRIGEAPGEVRGPAAALEHVDLPALEVRAEEVRVPGHVLEREALVRIVRRSRLEHLGGSAERLPPAGDRPVLA